MKSTQRINCNGKGLIIKRQSASIPDYLPPFTVALYISGVLYMKNNETYVQFYRKFSEWEWYKDVKVRSVFQHLVLMANWKNTKWQGIDLKRGERLTSIKHLAEENGLSEQNIRTILKKLKSTGELTIKSTSKYSIIYVVNYNKYQEANKQTNKQLTNNQQTTNKQLTTDNNYNKVNKVNKVNKKEIEKKKILFLERWFLKTSNISVTRKDQLILLINTYGIFKLKYIIDRTAIYWKREKHQREFRFKKRWNKFYENIDIFISDDSLSERIQNEVGWESKKNNLSKPVLEKLQDDDNEAWALMDKLNKKNNIGYDIQEG